MNDIFSVDKHFMDGLACDEYAGDYESDVDFAAYAAGRRMAGMPVLQTRATAPEGCAHRCESLHPANFKADA